MGWHGASPATGRPGRARHGNPSVLYVVNEADVKIVKTRDVGTDTGIVLTLRRRPTPMGDRKGASEGSGYGAAMVVVTGVLQKEAWDRDVMPPVERVRPGLWSIPVPIPDNPLRYVLVYAFELDNGVAIVDAGWNTDDAWMALNNGLVEAGGSIKDVQAVLVTHIHPDHYGLAGRVREESGAWIGLHPDDAEMLEARYIETDDLLARMREFLADAGVPATKLPDLNFASMMIRGQVTMAVPDVLFEDGQRVDVPGWDLTTVWTPGHSPGHVCFYSEQHKLLLSGDHVLPRITPNIGVHTQQFPNPLGEYLESLLKVHNLAWTRCSPPTSTASPTWQGRLDAIIAHHADRLAEIEKLIAEHPGVHGVGHLGGPAMVTPVARDRRLHATRRGG